MYFDAVTRIRDGRVLFNGTPEQVRAYLLRNPQIHSAVDVCRGKTLKYVSVKEYIG